ncbi:MAG: hypothetical protein UHD64_05705 [Bacteroidales bacterium]|nr:hypothetical protein [Bacteroidales bacterium]
MDKYLIHYDSDNSEIQLRVQHSVELGFCCIKEAIPIDKNKVPNSTIHKDEWWTWHNDWRKYFIKKYQLNPNDVQ